MQHDIAKIMAFIVTKLKGKFDVDLVVDLETRLIATELVDHIHISACLS